MDWTGLIKHGLTVFLFCQKLLLFFQSFLMIKNCCLQWIIQKQKFSTEKMRAIWTISFKMRAKIKIQEQFSLCLTLQMSFLLSAVCWKFVPVLIFTVKTLQTYQKSTLNFMLHWLGNYPQLHVQLSQVKRIPLD